MMTTESKKSEPKIGEPKTGESKDFKNYYEILEVSPNATLRNIENAYQNLALRWHPDKHTADRKLAERRFHNIS
jgi:curved DNA-binding protein CbpA